LGEGQAIVVIPVFTEVNWECDRYLVELEVVFEDDGDLWNGREALHYLDFLRVAEETKPQRASFDDLMGQPCRLEGERPTSLRGYLLHSGDAW
jgi:hypothetical protein